MSKFFYMVNVPPNDDRLSGLPILLQASYTCFAEENNDKVPPHAHWMTEIFLVTQGEGQFFYNDRTYDIKKGDLFFVNPGINHNEIQKAGLTVYILGVSNAHFVFNDENFTISLGNKLSFFEQYFSAIFKEAYDKKRDFVPLVHCLFAELCIMMRREIKIAFTSGQPENDDIDDKTGIKKRLKYNNAIEIARSYIEANYSIDFSLEQVAKTSYISKEHLIRAFKQKYDYSPMQYLAHFRIKIASSRLMFTTDPIILIASKTGFKSVNAFIRKFKIVTGMTPGEYRKSYLENKTFDLIPINIPIDPGTYNQ